MTYEEGSTYKLQHDYYEHIKLECSYVEDNTIWFINFNEIPDLYRLDRKTKKLYQWTSKYSSWDSLENTLEEMSCDDCADDVWSKRQAYTGYNDMNQGD